MNGNFEKFFIKKEVTDGTMVVPTTIIPVTSNALDLVVEQQKLEQIEGSMYGPTRSVPGKKRVSGRVDAYATPAYLGFLFDSLFGTPVSSVLGSKYQHMYDYTNSTVPTYTVEATRGSNVLRTSGVKVNDFAITVDNATFKVSANLLGRLAAGVHKITGVNLQQISFGEQVYFKVNDFLDVYDTSGSQIQVTLIVTSIIDSNTIEVSGSLSSVTTNCSVTLRQRSGTMIDENPVQFLESTSVLVNTNSVSVYNLSLNATNNITADEGFRSGSSYAQSLNTKMRSVTGSITVDNEDIIPFLSAHTSGSEVDLAISINNVNGDTLIVNGTITIDTVPSDVQTNTTLTSNIGFTFTSFTSIHLVDTHPTHTY